MKAYEKITDRIIAALEKGTVPWRKPWRADAQWPKNLRSKKQYRGVNVWSLMLAGYSSPWWVTFKQAKEMGGSVRKGEKGSVVVFWKLIAKESENDDGEKVTKRFPLLRFYYVFNVEQCDGLEGKIPEEPKREPVDPIEAGEAIIAGYSDAPPIRFGFDRAAYSPLSDEVLMPNRDAFVSSEAYYSTLFHELTHSTGHSKRLDRGLDTKRNAAFGSEDYSQEELVAEMGAAFLLGEAGIESPEETEQSAAYIAGWLERLKSDKKLVVVAAAQAQKSTDYIVGRTFDDETDD